MGAQCANERKSKKGKETKDTNTIKFESEYWDNRGYSCGNFYCDSTFKGEGSFEKEALQIITESNLHKIIEVSQLSTYECVYNDVCTVMDKEDSSKIAYYCKYNGRVKAGIDFSKVDIAVKEQEDGLLLITVTLPEVTLGEPEVDITSLKYMFMEDSADNNTVSGEAYDACIQDIKKKSQSEELIYDTAQENAVNIVKDWWNLL